MSIHGYSTKDKTIVAALRLVKGFIIDRGSIEEIKITQGLLRSLERARERYGTFLEQQRKVEQMKLARVKEELAKQTKDAVSGVEKEIRFLKRGIKVAETSVGEGNHELGETMKGKTLNRDKIV